MPLLLFESWDDFITLSLLPADKAVASSLLISGLGVESGIISWSVVLGAVVIPIWERTLAEELGGAGVSDGSGVVDEVGVAVVVGEGVGVTGVVTGGFIGGVGGVGGVIGGVLAEGAFNPADTGGL